MNLKKINKIKVLKYGATLMYHDGNADEFRCLFLIFKGQICDTASFYLILSLLKTCTPNELAFYKPTNNHI